jgi:(2Fe-2S) ferredoxin
MGLLKGLSRGIQNKPWVPFAKSTAESEVAASGPVEGMPREKSSFCDPGAALPCLTVCAPKSGCDCGCEAVREAVKGEIARRGLNTTVGDLKVGCSGTCKHGALIGFPQKGFFYTNVRAEDVPEIVDETIVHGRILFPFLSVSPDRSYRSDIHYEKETGLLAAIHGGVCMVEVAKYFLDFEEGLSCGKCVPCRIGMKRMQELIDKIVTGRGAIENLDQIRDLCQTMKDTPHCEFAATSSRPVLSAITYFEDEFMAHIERQECPAGVCKELVEIRKEREVEAKQGKKK